MTHGRLRKSLASLRELDSVLGVLEDRSDELTAEQEAMLEERVLARGERDWARSDELRAMLAADGIHVEDTPDGQRWRRSGGG